MSSVFGLNVCYKVRPTCEVRRTLPNARVFHRQRQRDRKRGDEQVEK